MAKEGDIFGDGVNVTARLEGLVRGVRGGEICVSRGVRDHLRHRGGFLFEDLGEQLVKNIAHPIRAFRLRIGEDKSEHEVSRPEEDSEPSELAADTVEPGQAMTGNQGLKVSDDQHGLKAGPRGPTLIEDFYLREKITQFDHADS